MIPPRFRCEFYWRHFAETSAVGLRRLCLQCNCPILLLLTAFAYAVPLLALNLKSTFSALRSFVCKSFPARTGTCWIHCCWVCCSLLFAWDIGWWFTDRKHCYNSQMKNPLHGLESSMVFEGTTGLYERLYRFNSRWVLRKKEKYGNSKKWIWRIFSLFLRSNLSDDDKRPDLKTGVELHFWVWNRVRIWRTGRHTLTKNSQEYPPEMCC